MDSFDFTQIYQRVCHRIKNWKQENFYAVALKEKKVVGIKRFGTGECKVSINPSDIEKYIYQRKGDGYIMVHNHPTTLMPSSGDKWATKTIKNRVKYHCVGSYIINRRKAWKRIHEV